MIPADLHRFYSLAGGASLFMGGAYAIEVVAPTEMVPGNALIAKCDGADDASADWFVVAHAGGQYVTIDLSAARSGRCYDSFWDRHAVRGNCPIIARSFAELLAGLLAAAGGPWPWLQPDFRAFGDAYD